MPNGFGRAAFARRTSPKKARHFPLSGESMNDSAPTLEADNLDILLACHPETGKTGLLLIEKETEVVELIVSFLTVEKLREFSNKLSAACANLRREQENRMT